MCFYLVCVCYAAIVNYLGLFSRWTKIKGGDVSRNPSLKFGSGVHIKVSKIA